MEKKNKLLSIIVLVLCLSLTACDLSIDGDGGNITAELTKLPTPVISSIENGYIYWNEVANASSYVVKINNYQESAGNQLKYSISTIMDGRIDANVPTELHIYLKAKGNQIFYSDSEWSAEETFIYTKKESVQDERKKTVLSTPIFSYDDKNNIFEWQSVDGADGYELSVNDESIIVPQTTKCVYSPMVKANENFTFTMRALAPEKSVKYENSEWTRLATFKYSPNNEKTIDPETLNKAQELRIGYAYNFIDDEYFDVTKSSVNSVININELFKTAKLNIQPSSYTKSESIYNESIKEFQANVALSLSSEVSAKGGFSIYSANVSAGLKSSASIGFSKYGKSGFLNAYSYAEYKNYQVVEYGNTLDLSSFLTDKFKSIVNKEGAYSSMSNSELAEFIINNYGTHVILGVKTGGRLDYYYSFATNNSKVSADLKKEITANASAGVANIISASANNPVPDGMSYNSYVIKDDKIAVMDSVDVRFAEEWLNKVQKILDGKKPDYLVIQHMEPDHSASIMRFMEVYPQTTVVSNQKAFAMMKNFFGTDFSDCRVIVGDGDSLELGTHKLNFVLAPMVHWPEVMFTYESCEKVFFSADAFGKFGALDVEKPWIDEARRYYIGIVGKYGIPVQSVLKKAASLDIKTICPLHGPVLDENLGYYLGLYNTWSSYAVEEEGVVVAYTSVYGNTKKAVELLVEKLGAYGCKKVEVYDLARCDMSQAVAAAFEYGTLVLASTTYNGDVFPFMREFVEHLTERNFSNRKVAVIENGSWAPLVAKVIGSMLEKSKNIAFAQNTVRILSALNEENAEKIDALAKELCE